MDIRGWALLHETTVHVVCYKIFKAFGCDKNIIWYTSSSCEYDSWSWLTPRIHIRYVYSIDYYADVNMQKQPIVYAQYINNHGSI